MVRVEILNGILIIKYGLCLLKRDAVFPLIKKRF